MRVTLIDSPVANVGSIARALRAAGAALAVTADPAAIATANKLVLPGVGTFPAAMRWLEQTTIATALRTAVASGATLLGICVGHQLLFDASNELAPTRGLGFLPGTIEKFDGTLPIPQIGWNRLTTSASPLFDGVESGTSFYFVNSYAARNAQGEIATADYDGPFTAAVQRGRVFGVQFHPEKSSQAGLAVLRNYLACN
ncbi:MAG TPA: imidazole glycerol phosphate synthase subunit HisH [Thermoanaerobaculia bacterium]|jgi:glutamine amidotransferase